MEKLGNRPGDRDEASITVLIGLLGQTYRQIDGHPYTDDALLLRQWTFKAAAAK